MVAGEPMPPWWLRAAGARPATRRWRGKRGPTPPRPTHTTSWAVAPGWSSHGHLPVTVAGRPSARGCAASRLRFADRASALMRAGGRVGGAHGKRAATRGQFVIHVRIRASTRSRGAADGERGCTGRRGAGSSSYSGWSRCSWAGACAAVAGVLVERPGGAGAMRPRIPSMYRALGSSHVRRGLRQLAPRRPSRRRGTASRSARRCRPGSRRRRSRSRTALLRTAGARLPGDRARRGRRPRGRDRRGRFDDHAGARPQPLHRAPAAHDLAQAQGGLPREQARGRAGRRTRSSRRT